MNLLFLSVLEVVNVFSSTMYEQVYTTAKRKSPQNVFVSR